MSKEQAIRDLLENRLQELADTSETAQPGSWERYCEVRDLQNAIQEILARPDEPRATSRPYRAPVTGCENRGHTHFADFAYVVSRLQSCHPTAANQPVSNDEVVEGEW